MRRGLSERLAKIALADLRPAVDVIYVQPTASGSGRCIDLKCFATRVAAHGDPMSCGLHRACCAGARLLGVSKPELMPAPSRVLQVRRPGTECPTAHVGYHDADQPRQRARSNQARLRLTHRPSLSGAQPSARLTGMAQHSKHGDLGTALGFAMLLLGLLLVAPGVVTVYLGARLLGPDLDCGQHWAFGIAAAFLEYLAIRITCPERPALKTYLAVCAGTVGLLGLAYWGFHARWPAELMAALGGGTP